MEDKKTTDTTHTDTEHVDTKAVAQAGDTTNIATDEVATESSSVADDSDTATAATTPGSMKQYGIAVAIVALFGAGLVFVLEQQGRMDTNYFGWLHSSAQNQPVATVNGVEISGAEFAQNRDQVIISAQQQGVDTENPEVMQEIESQALEVLINTQLLRQEAEAAGLSASDEDIEARYQEIVESVGGEEALMSRMDELGITAASLRSDIEGELLVQALIDSAVDTSTIVVSEEDVVAFYEQASSEMDELPPLEEVRVEIEQQIRTTQEQALIAEYIEALRAAATIEVLI